MNYIVQNNVTVNSVQNCYGNFPTAINLLTKNIIKAKDFDMEQLDFNTLNETLPKINAEDTYKRNFIVKFE